ncbi:MAG: anti-sigma regulatory factor [Deltaproteobacteria bacterium]|nr:anti-sigma regulatory factor [Deltaproteobacteria bacterium]
MPADGIVSIRHEADILSARIKARLLATSAGFSELDLTLIATAISEIARNMLTYGGGGEMELVLIDERGRAGLSVVARDQGPGIPDVTRAMEDGFSTGNGLGLGLPGARRLMDEFVIQSELGAGTTISMKKWRHK